MKGQKKNIDFSKIRTKLINSRLLGIELPPCEIDIANNCYWLEEAQGDTTENIIRKCQVKFYFEKDSEKIEIVIGVHRTVYETSTQTEILYNLNYLNESTLVVKDINDKIGAINPLNYISRLDFKVSEMELWNIKNNQVNVYVNEDYQLGNIIILKDIAGKEIYVEGFESDDQENCLKLTILNKEDTKMILKKEYEWERIDLVN